MIKLHILPHHHFFFLGDNTSFSMSVKFLCDPSHSYMSMVECNWTCFKTLEDILLLVPGVSSVLSDWWRVPGFNFAEVVIKLIDNTLFVSAPGGCSCCSAVNDSRRNCHKAKCKWLFSLLGRD